MIADEIKQFIRKEITNIKTKEIENLKVEIEKLKIEVQILKEGGNI